MITIIPMKIIPRTFFIGALALATSAIAVGDSVSMTIYNQNFGVVREQFDLKLEEGAQSVNFTGMTRTLEPSSVVLRARDGSSPFRIIEQSYRPDPINESSALTFFEGEELDFERNTRDGTIEIVRGRLIRAGHSGGEGPIVEQDGLLRFGLPGKPLFPRLDDEGILTPTLTWRIQSANAQTIPAELSYLTQGLNWEADYNFVAPVIGDEMQMMGWVTITNRSGRVYRDAQLRLLAGTVNRIQPDRSMMRAQAMMAMESAAPAVTGEAFDDFHLYTIAEPTTLRDQEQKQIEFLRAESVKTPRHYIISSGGSATFRGEPQLQSGLRAATQRLPVQSFVRFKNSEENGLGVPLPAGRARFYRAASDGSLQFIGENRIGHTPRDETVELRLGDAFDWVAERTQESFNRNDSRRRITETIRIGVRNQSDNDGSVEILENLFRWSGWEIRSSSVDYERIDAQTIRFPLDVPARGQASVTYTVEYNW